MSSGNVHVTASATGICHASRDKIWKALLDKIRAPEKYVGSRNVQILKDESDHVIRHMQIGPENAPITIKENITWDESKGLVRFTSIDDETKFGHVDNVIGNEVSDDKGKGFELTFSFDWTFTDKAPKGQGEDMKAKIPVTSKAAVEKTISVIESH